MLNITIVITCYRLLSPCYVPREVSHSFYNRLLNAYYKVVREAVNKTGKNPHPVDLTPGGIDMKYEVLVVQSCPTLCDPMGCKLPGSSVHGILQARILEFVAIPFSRESS